LEEFDYGTVVITTRYDKNKPMDNTQEIIYTGIRVGLIRAIVDGTYVWQMQVVYLNNKNKIRSKLYNIDEYQITIKHQGSMNVEL
jgi:hypothetical protein